MNRLKSFFSLGFFILNLFLPLESLSAKNQSTDKPQPIVDEKARPPLKTTKQKYSYTVGYETFERFRLESEGLSFDTEAIMMGINDALNGTPSQLGSEERRNARMHLANDIHVHQFTNEKSLENSAKQFLNNNAKLRGIRMTRSGLQYLILSSGKGAHPNTKSEVAIINQCQTHHGQILDPKIDRKTPVFMKMDSIIKGVREALLLMSEGSRWKLFIPPHLAFGNSNRPGVQPYSVLICDLELIEVVNGSLKGQ